MMASTAWLSSEADLLPAAIAGDEAAFDALVGPLIEPAYKQAAVMLRHGEEARDAVQDACLMAWKKQTPVAYLCAGFQIDGASFSEDFVTFPLAKATDIHP
jgi:hypothetical protein